MADITISSVNFSGYNADFTFYPFTGGTINLGNHTIPYFRTSDNYEGVYDMDISWLGGISVGCSVQIGASDCVNIETSGATYDYGGIYTYIGQGYLSYDSGTGQWAVICSDTDPKSAALYYLEGSNGQFLGNVFDVVARTTEPRITTFILLIGLGCGAGPLIPPYGVTSEIPTYVNGLPAVGSFGNGGDSGGTYTLANNPTCDPGVDTDAAAYLADVELSGGTIDATITSAVNTLFTDLKSNGLYSKMIAMYPYVGGTASSHSINALLNKSFDITWNGGMTHGISGSTGNGTNAYGATNFQPSNYVDKTKSSFGLYITQKGIKTSNNLHGTFNNSRMNFSSNISSGNLAFCLFGDGAGQYNSPYSGHLDGNFIVIRTGATDTHLYGNGSFIASVSGYVNNTGSNPGFYLFEYQGAPGSWFNDDTLAFTFFADDLSYAEAITLDGIINTFQTSLGRNTY